MSEPSLPEERFRALFAEHRRSLLGYALRRCPTTADAADIVAETFLVAWRRIDVVPVGDESRPWLYGVARRVLANQRRGELRRSSLGDRLRAELVTLVPDRVDPDAASAVAVRQAMATLAPDDRELLWLTSWEGLNPTEVAQVLSVPPVTVRTRLHRARARLRAALDEVTYSTDGGRDSEPASERNDERGHVASGERVLARPRRSDR